MGVRLSEPRSGHKRPHPPHLYIITYLLEINYAELKHSHPNCPGLPWPVLATDGDCFRSCPLVVRSSRPNEGEAVSVRGGAGGHTVFDSHSFSTVEIYHLDSGICGKNVLIFSFFFLVFGEATRCLHLGLHL